QTAAAARGLVHQAVGETGLADIARDELRSGPARSSHLLAPLDGAAGQHQAGTGGRWRPGHGLPAAQGGPGAEPDPCFDLPGLLRQGLWGRSGSELGASPAVAFSLFRSISMLVRTMSDRLRACIFSMTLAR